MPKPRKYLPLVHFLTGLPQEQQRVTLTFAALERLVGPLPASARNAWYWRSSRLARIYWEAYGFAAALHRSEPAVTFTRQPATPAIPLPALRPSKYQPLLQFLAALPTAEQSVTLTFGELQQFVGELASAAWLRSYWRHSRQARKNWQAIGFHADLDQSGRAVVFTRQARDR